MKTHFIPKQIKAFQELYKLNYNSLLTDSNPKILKSDIKTFILHLSPSNSSGVINLCKSAFNCRKLCLHRSGNILHLKNKIEARIKRTIAYSDNKKLFFNLLILSIIRNYRKNNSLQTAYRLNGTSDIKLEYEKIYIDPSISDFIYNKFSFNINSGYYENIFEVFKHEKNIIFYDYTKESREYKNLLKEYSYHLTFSFDGANNIVNINRCYEAMKHEVNIAACIYLKKSQSLPNTFYSEIFNKKFSVIDGDNERGDMRFLDPKNKLVLLKFKKPYKIKYTKKDIQNFCIR
tara:strand:+ start:18576 stop:19445 length:870 start_codon:yes stop_codon:yes gene_type:complete